MSTTFYRLGGGVTSLRLATLGGHTEISIWVNGGRAGALTLREKEVPEFLYLLRGREFCNRASTGLGMLLSRELSLTDSELSLVDPELRLISEYGELTTVGKLLESCK